MPNGTPQSAKLRSLGWDCFNLNLKMTDETEIDALFTATTRSWHAMPHGQLPASWEIESNLKDIFSTQSDLSESTLLVIEYIGEIISIQPLDEDHLVIADQVAKSFSSLFLEGDSAEKVCLGEVLAKLYEHFGDSDDAQALYLEVSQIARRLGMLNTHRTLSQRACGI